MTDEHNPHAAYENEKAYYEEAQDATQAECQHDRDVDRLRAAEAEVERLRALVKDAYDEGQEDCPDDKFYGRTGQWKDSNACADLTKENAAKETP